MKHFLGWFCLGALVALGLIALGYGLGSIVLALQGHCWALRQ